MLSKQHGQFVQTFRLTTLGLMAAVILLGATGWASAFYMLTARSASQLSLAETQLLDMNTGRTGEDMLLEKGAMVTVLHGGEPMHVTAEEETVTQFLDRMEVTPSPLEMVGIEQYPGGVTLTVSDALTTYVTVTEHAPHNTTYLDQPDLPYGEQHVIRPGVDGERTAVYEQKWVSGTLRSSQMVEELSTTAVEAVVELGTTVNTVDPDDRVVDVIERKNGGYLVFSSGKTMRFKEAKSMTATAYTSGVGKVTDITATGTEVHVGVVAVDKKVIPLGSWVYVMAKNREYGLAHAEDTGVKGNKIDLYYDTYEECMKFGRRSATVYILDVSETGDT